MLHILRRDILKAGALHPFQHRSASRVAPQVCVIYAVEIIVDVPPDGAFMWIMPDHGKCATRLKYSEGFTNKFLVIAKMMDGIHSINKIESVVLMRDLNS